MLRNYLGFEEVSDITQTTMCTAQRPCLDEKELRNLSKEMNYLFNDDYREPDYFQASVWTAILTHTAVFYFCLFFRPHSGAHSHTFFNGNILLVLYMHCTAFEYVYV